MQPFFQSLKQNNIKPDFFSWHMYASTVDEMRRQIRLARQRLDQSGFTETESILNEWNYVKGWHQNDWLYSLKTMKNLKGSAFIASTICMAQYEPLDHLMFYDARPCAMNSLFNTDFVCECLKGYYPFYMFNQLYTQEFSVPFELEGKDIWAAAAGGNEQNVMLSYFNDDTASPEKTVEIAFKNVKNTDKVRLQYYCLDENHDCELIKEEIFCGNDFSAYIKMPLYSTYFLKISNII
jgi:hypothetical protein